jgi:hypothetical protein
VTLGEGGRQKIGPRHSKNDPHVHTSADTHTIKLSFRHTLDQSKPRTDVNDMVLQGSLHFDLRYEFWSFASSAFPLKKGVFSVGKVQVAIEGKKDDGMMGGCVYS